MAQPLAKADNFQKLNDLLNRAKSQIAIALPKHMTAERMIRVALTAFQRTPALQECSALSILGCVVQASELGLELSGILGHAYLVPYYNKNTNSKEAQFQVGYRGLIDLAYRSGRVQTFQPRAVYANDRFEVYYGTKAEILHVPTMEDPGELIAVYAVCILKDGGMDFEVMSKAQIDLHKAKYSKQRGDNSPWVTAYEEMAKKTVIRRLAKRLPLSIELTKAAVLDEYGEAEIPQNLGLHVATPQQLAQSRAETLNAALLSAPPPETMIMPDSTNGRANGTNPEDNHEADMGLNDPAYPDKLAANYLDAIHASKTAAEIDTVMTHATGDELLLKARFANLITAANAAKAVLAKPQQAARR